MSEFKRWTAGVCHGEKLRSRYTNENKMDEDLYSALLAFQQTSMVECQNWMTKFTAKLSQVDPVTGKSRYGETMRQKILDMEQRTLALLTFLDPQESDMEANVSKDLDRFLQALEDQAQARMVEERAVREAQEQAAQMREAQEQRDIQLRQVQAQVQAAADKEAQEALTREADHVREQRRRHHEETLEAKRRAEAHLAMEYSTDLEGFRRALTVLRANTTPGQYLVALSVLEVFCGHVVQFPDNPDFRHIRLENEAFQQELGQFEGAEFCLYALGFRLTERERQSTTNPNPIMVVGEKNSEQPLPQPPVNTERVWICEEPPLVDMENVDAWSDWYDQWKGFLHFLEEHQAEEKRMVMN